MPECGPPKLVFAIAGLDSRKEDFAGHTDGYLKQGLGIFTVDLPGTGESLHAAAEVNSDRIFSAVLDWLAKRPEVDAGRILVQGRSWSGHWAAKLAVTEAKRLQKAFAAARAQPLDDVVRTLIDDATSYAAGTPRDDDLTLVIAEL